MNSIFYLIGLVVVVLPVLSLLYCAEPAPRPGARRRVLLACPALCLGLSSSGLCAAGGRGPRAWWNW